MSKRQSKSNNNRNRNSNHFNRPELTAKTPNQTDYIKSILENDITISSGPAGCGKSFIAAGLAAQEIMRGNFKTVLITRPLVCAGSKLGALPGEVHEKINPFLIPMKEHLKYFLGMANYGDLNNNNHIVFEPLELMRGRNFDQTFMILDEAQNCTKEQIKMFITRMGFESKVVVNGDINQTDIQGHSGLAECMRKLACLRGVGVCQLDHGDIQRNGILAGVIKALED